MRRLTGLLALVFLCQAGVAGAGERGLFNKDLGGDAKKQSGSGEMYGIRTPTDKLARDLSSSGNSETHTIKGMWLSNDGHICMLMLEDGVKRSCLLTNVRTFRAHMVFVSNGGSLLFTFFRDSEMKRGKSENGFTAYADRHGPRVWSLSADIDG